jgi:hypothetical protein
MLTIVTPTKGRRNTHHALEDYADKGREHRSTWRTACRRYAGEWNRVDDMNISEFLRSESACKRCLDSLI